MSKSRLSVPVAFGWLATILVLMCGATFFGPYDPAEQDRLHPYAPPTAVHWNLLQAGRPFVCEMTRDAASNSGYREDCSRKYPLRLFHSVSNNLRLVSVDSPGGLHLLGADQYGRDQFSRLLHGIRLSMLTATLAAILSTFLGVVLGMCAGYFGRHIDSAIMWVIELFLSLPWLFLLIGLRALLPLHMPAWQVFGTISLFLGLIGWARIARLVRGVVTGVKGSEFVQAARGLGASDLYIIRRHISPAAWDVALTQAPLAVSKFVLAEITLSFFGLGVDEPQASWGQLISVMQNRYVIVAHPFLCIPLLVLIPTCFAFLVLSPKMDGRYSRL